MKSAFVVIAGAVILLSSSTSRGVPRIRYPGFSGGDFPGFADMDFECFVADLIQYDAYPSARPHIRRFEIRFRRIFDERGLESREGRQPYGDPAVLVVILGEHRENALVLPDKKRGRAVGQLFRHTRHLAADPPNAVELGFPGFLARALRLLTSRELLHPEFCDAFDQLHR